MTETTKTNDEKYFEYLDKLRLGEVPTSTYTKREMLAHNFALPIDDATKIVEAYNDKVSERKQFLTE